MSVQHPRQEKIDELRLPVYEEGFLSVTSWLKDKCYSGTMRAMS